jgi:hypothetical protein
VNQDGSICVRLQINVAMREQNLSIRRGSGLAKRLLRMEREIQRSGFSTFCLRMAVMASSKEVRLKKWTPDQEKVEVRTIEGLENPISETRKSQERTSDETGKFVRFSKKKKKIGELVLSKREILIIECRNDGKAARIALIEVDNGKICCDGKPNTIRMNREKEDNFSLCLNLNILQNFSEPISSEVR